MSEVTAPILPKTKICTKCGKRKRLDCYGKKATGRYGLQATCADCERARSKLKVEQLSDAYVAKTVGLPIAMIPPALLEAKRLHIQIKRQLKEMK